MGDRGSGKTSVLISRVLEDEDAILLVQTESHRKLIIDKFPEVGDRLFTFNYFLSGEFRGYSDFPKGVYIDELDAFLAAVLPMYGLGGVVPVTVSLTPGVVGTPPRGCCSSTWGIREIWRKE